MSINGISLGMVIDGRYEVLEELGGGDSGTVYKVRQLSIDLERALKIFDPKLAGVPRENLERTFKNEISLLRQLGRITHRNVVKILDAGSVTVDDKVAPYYVMDLVRPSPALRHALNLNDYLATVKDKTQLLRVLGQLLDGLSYLHYSRVLHCDIKPPNVLLEEQLNGDFEVRITDLGVSKLLINDPASASRTYLYGSPLYAPTYALSYVNTNEFIDRATLEKEYFPHYDLFCLGATLVECLSQEKFSIANRDFAALLSQPKPGLLAMLDIGDYDILRHIALRLTNPNRALCYSCVDEIQEDLNKLRHEYLWPLGVQEMAVSGAYRTLTQPREKAYLSKRAYKLVSHPLFQRLHSMNQLNFVYMLYSGAKHSRFLHSTCAFEMAKRYIEGLVADPTFKCLMNRRDYELLLACALLHDIGHYPLAHALEDLHDRPTSQLHPAISRDYETSQRFLNQAGVAGWPSLADLLEADWNLDPNVLLRIIGNGTPASDSESLIQSMIDGVIDVDKVSYLLYDSFYTGARFGLGIDLEAFLAALVAIPADSSTNRVAQVAISENGIAPDESIISARYGMFTRVYWHHTNRSIMAMVQFAASKCFFGGESDFTFDRYLDESTFLSDVEALRVLNREMIKRVSAASKGGTAITNPLEGLLDGQRSIYSRLATFQGITEDEDSRRIHDYLIRRRLEELEVVRQTLTKEIAGLVGEDLADGDVLLDVPQAEKGKDVLKTLWVDRPYARPRYEKLPRISGLVEAVYENFQKIVKKCRIYIRPDIWERLSDGHTQSRIQSRVREILDSMARHS